MAATTKLADPATSRAVLIGVHHYDYLDDLPGVKNNITRLRKLLLDEKIWGLPRSNCRILDQPLTQRLALESVEWASKNASDTLLIYYAGHGFPDAGDRSGLYLALPDTKGDELYSALDYKWLRKAVEKSKAKRKVVILDCCYSGRALHGQMGGESIDLASHATIHGTCILAAAAELEIALAPPSQEYTAFTGELIGILSDGIVGAPEVLDMNTVFLRLVETLSFANLPVPHQRNTDAGGSIAIARNLAFVPPQPANHVPPTSSKKLHRSPQLFGAIALCLAMSFTLAGAPYMLKGTHPISTPAESASSIPSLRRVALAEVGEADFRPAAFASAIGREKVLVASLKGRDLSVQAIEAPTGRSLWNRSTTIELTTHEFVRLNIGSSESTVIVRITQLNRVALMVFDSSTGVHLWSFSASNLYAATVLTGDRLLMRYENAETAGYWPEMAVYDLRNGSMAWKPVSEMTLPVLPPLTDGLMFNREWLSGSRPSAQLLELNKSKQNNLRVLDAVTGEAKSSASIPIRYETERLSGDAPDYDTRAYAVDGTALIVRIPRDDVSETATVYAYDVMTGTLKWETNWLRDTSIADGTNVIPCGVGLVCLEEFIDQRLRLTPYTAATGQKLASIDVGVLGGAPIGFIPVYIGKDYTALARSAGELNASEILLIEPQKGRIVLRENAWVPRLLSNGKLLLLRGQLVGPELGDVNVRVVDINNATTTTLQGITTIATMCTTELNYMVCPADSDSLQILAL